MASNFNGLSLYLIFISSQADLNHVTHSYGQKDVTCIEIEIKIKISLCFKKVTDLSSGITSANELHKGGPFIHLSSSIFSNVNLSGPNLFRPTFESQINRCSVYTG